jgi:glycolate oxidase iron-sulfur subunit
VNYAGLFEAARAQVEESEVLRSPKRDLVRWFTIRLLFMHPRLLRFAGRLLWLYQAGGLQSLVRHLGLTRLLPGRLRTLEPATPSICRHFSDALIAPVEKSRGAMRHRVAVLTGCVQDLVLSNINRATVDVLRENHCEVHTPRAQPCCGSLHAHNGDLAAARTLARRYLDLIDPFAFDAIITNAGGCGSHLRTYDHLLAEDPLYAPRAVEWSRKVRDIHEWLVETGFRRPAGAKADVASITVTYHESCHLCHGQKVSAQPREIIKSIPGLNLRECDEATWCCGSAGIYNITQPKTATWLQQRKIGHLRNTGASIIATANPGCHLQIENGLRMHGDASTKVEHPIVLLAAAYAIETNGSRERAGQ